MNEAAPSSRPTSVAQLFDLTDRTALVTGGSSGIGRAIAWAIANAGARVVLVARRREALQATVEAFRAEGLTASALACDLTDRRALDDAAAHASQAFGEPDILVNAAGINIRRPYPDITATEWDSTLALNLTAPFLLTQALAAPMKQKGWGRIINVASLQSVRAFGNSGAYGASKGGIVQLTRATAEYWSRFGVTCNAIAPGFFSTPLTKAIFDDPTRAAALAEQTMVGRNGELPDLHGIAVFLASRASDYITGQTLFVDGGFSAR